MKCSPAPNSAKPGAATGWMWPALPNRAAAGAPSSSRVPGASATIGSGPSPGTLLGSPESAARWSSLPRRGEGAEEAARRAGEEKPSGLQKELAAARVELAGLTKGASEPTAAPGRPIAIADLPGLVV